MRVFVTTLILLLCALTLTACKTKSGPLNEAPVTSPGEIATSAGAIQTDSNTQQADVQPLEGEAFGEGELLEEELVDTVATSEQEIEEGMRVLSTVFFQFDSHELSAEALRVLEENARWLALHPSLRVVVEGNCDERGTIEYNIDLGAKRARAVRNHLARLGISTARMETISYGEERPVDSARNESAWAQNRRAEFVLEKP